MTEPTALIDKPSNPDITSDFRISAASLAEIRPHCLSRWIARVFKWGEYLHGEHEMPPGHGPMIARYTSELGEAMAARAVGIPVNYAWRPQDGLKCLWTPYGAGRPLHGLHMEMLRGFVENAWADADGVMATLLILRADADADLRALERSGQLEHAALCLCHRARSLITTTPWNVKVHDVVDAEPWALSFASIGHTPGCRVIRRLELDEEPRPEDSAPTERTLVPSSWPRPPHGSVGADVDLAPGAVQQPQLGVAAVGTSNVQNQAITNNAAGGGGAVTFGTTETLVATVTLSTGSTPGNVLVSASFRHLKLSGSDDTATFMLRKNNVSGEILDAADAFHIAGWLSGSLQGVDSAPAASQVYVITAKRNVAGSGQAKAAITAVVYKR